MNGYLAVDLYVLIFNIEYVDHACIRAHKLQSFILPYDPTWLDSLWCLVCWNLVLICGELKGWKFDPTVVVLRQSLGWLGSDKAPSLSWWPYKKRGRKNYRTRQVHPSPRDVLHHPRPLPARRPSPDVELQNREPKQAYFLSLKYFVLL